MLIAPLRLAAPIGLLLMCIVPYSWALAQDATAQFRRWDRNADGTLSKSELPERNRANFERVDTDKNGVIDLAEHQAFIRRAARNAIPESVQAKLDIAYVLTEPHPRQRLDIYLPKQASEQPRPLVIWIHGGGWRAGNRFPCPAVFLTQHGYAVASVGYRLSDAAIFPAQVHDCKLAIAYLREHAQEWNLDPKRFGVWGSSAGGHLTALVGTSGGADELTPDGIDASAADVQAACDYFGPTNLLLMDAQSDENSRMVHDADDSPESKLLGGPLQQQTDLAKMANPITYVDKSDPPFLIVHGDKDPLVPHQQSRILHAALTANGVSAELVIVPGGGHGPFRDPEQLERVRSFFDAALKPAKGQP